MKNLLIGLSTLFVGISAVFGQGMTTRISQDRLIPVETQNYEKPVLKEKSNYSRSVAHYNLATLDSLSMEIMLGPGEYASVYVNTNADTLGIVYWRPTISGDLATWVESAPDEWKRQLIRNLSYLGYAYADDYSAMLSEADPLWLDELYFCLAHLAYQILELPDMPQLLLENVRDIYAHDSLLSYVEIIDLGSPGGPDHRTIARYFTIDTGMVAPDTVSITPDIYYYNVMFPKITDDICRFINPVTGNSDSPPDGVFWRTWFWDIAETLYVDPESLRCWPLGESLMAQNVLWNGIHNIDVENGAIGVITRWIKDILIFTSDDERPHQPVRIYEKHIGRCGEHADITDAACRMALIPSRNIEAISSDHTWDEFYTGWRWAGWEPVNTSVDDQWVYSDGWGRQFATVYEYTGKGLMVPRTERYSHEIANINFNVYDGDYNPVDGAQVLVVSDETGGLYYDCVLITGSRGTASDAVGDGKHLYWRVDSDAGSNPAAPNTVTNLITNTVDSANYDRAIGVPGHISHFVWGYDSLPEYSVAYVSADIQPIGEFIAYEGIFDDMAATYHEWSEDAYGFRMFSLSDYEFSQFEAGGTFYVFDMLECCDTGYFESLMDTGEYWIVLSNQENLRNTLVGQLTVVLHDTLAAINEPPKPQEFAIDVHPNPFNSSCEIKVSNGGGLINQTLTEIEIYDLRGNVVDVLGTPITDYIWTPGQSISSGIYLVRANYGDGQTITKRIAYLK